MEHLAPNDGIELGRLVLLDELAANAETWMLGRVFRLLRQAKPNVRGVVSYAAPEPRYNAAGELVKTGHLGTIYKAHNGQYHGRSRARTLRLLPSGQIVNERALSKIRNGECSSAYALRSLLGAGAPERQFGESGRDYLARLETEGFFRRLQHPGNFCFT